jgi:hypothetical protein
MDYFNDRRPCAAPCDDDYATPVHRTSLVDANARVRAATPAYRMSRQNTAISTLAVQRHRAREAGAGDFGSVGEYLEFLRGTDY